MNLFRNPYTFNSTQVYLSYIRDFGPFLSAFTFAMYLGGQGLETGANYWLSVWADANNADNASANANIPFYLGIYSGIGVTQMIVMILR